MYMHIYIFMYIYRTDMDAVLYHGSQEDREEIRKYEFGYMSRTDAIGYKMQVVITTPETCLIADRKTPNGRMIRYVQMYVHL
jgi:hypothetical protein